MSASTQSILNIGGEKQQLIALPVHVRALNFNLPKTLGAFKLT